MGYHERAVSRSIAQELSYDLIDQLRQEGIVDDNFELYGKQPNGDYIHIRGRREGNMEYINVEIGNEKKGKHKTYKIASRPLSAFAREIAADELTEMIEKLQGKAIDRMIDVVLEGLDQQRVECTRDDKTGIITCDVPEIGKISAKI
jgi:hypothetical protein